ncbi:copper homeostasis protein [Gordonia malaquae]|uniref:PF03932 family protein CutC n=1 Tax=Gordonia malaquae NBRC 108250 TaxID=1223542 RepID=M3UTA3_GORML|nr:copper homeostasis protein CutC [Gordonia malaquae]GAC78557.1 copper homeostasis protein CutC [Gordonia malaquae NBRC 108250]SED52639.1 copper homeostasis protein [Gordonia malaquae]
MTTLEIAVQDAAGAAVALAGGADRVELCAALGATGGLTPSPATIAATVATGVEVHALIRNRPGGFVYSPDEVRVLADDVRRAVDLGAAGVVIGALQPGGALDAAATAILLDAAGDADVTFHRAIDTVSDPVRTLHQLADIGVLRVLTSGGAPKAGDGLNTLAALIAADTGVEVMAGGGVTPTSIPSLLAVGVDAVHLSAKAVVADPGATGPGGGTASGLEVTDPAVVAAARAATYTKR